MKKLCIACCIAVALCILPLAMGQEAPQKQYRIFSGGFSRHHGMRWALCYHSDTDDPPSFSPQADFTDGLIVPVTIRNFGSAPVTIRSGKASWTDFVSVKLKYMPDEEDETNLEEPASSYTARRYARLHETLDVLETGEQFSSNDYDEIWLIIEFDDPGKLREGDYVWRPKVDFTALAAAIPDLSRENIYEHPGFGNTPGAEFAFLTCHRRIGFKTVAEKKAAMNHYLFTAGERFDFGKEPEARAFLAKALKINPDSTPALISKAGFDYETCRFEEALASVLRATALLKGNGDPYYTGDEECRALDLQDFYKYAGECHEELGDYDEAEYCYVLSREMLNGRAFDPGPEIDDHWSAERSCLGSALEYCRSPWVRRRSGRR